ncbi:MAG: hypothetical protein K2N75_06985 [Helicobacter sp.]|uniref:hypothetical protein n=1 Tax=Helicobacter sp. TaxID=218 RepID=UPI0023C9F681|nr:hypothetical protein [Helicobacter sp.]MDE5926599.1 hypothetical protein [Helicobacter sp.]MDE7175768.1 hypothetical protein [Helicobacter sp.]
MKKKALKAQIKSLNHTLQALEKKCACLELIVKWQSEKLEIIREARLKQKEKDYI